ncbi:MAG: type II toxin-antitoxin system PemK/MazF family toxin, partial [Bdellovibrionaceae bacterium]|nr:type II toxin-antitoxin system PemK/MazF family toxin [Pseudobdellovibrionaceae bacterium]
MSYIPARGDFISLNFNSSASEEQQAIVISAQDYNKKTGLVVCCPVITKVKGYPFEVLVSGKKINGAIIVDHLKNIRWRVCKVKFIEKANSVVMEECV